jgi:hypothetical protein
VEFVVENVVPGQAFLRFLRFSPLNAIPPVLHIYISFTCFQRSISLAVDSVVK